MTYMTKVLLVEDDRDVRAAAERALTLEGFEVFSVSNLKDAEDNVEGMDVVLLDLGLPDADGFFACRRMVEHHVPVVIATARDQEVDRIVCLELGADDFVQKPYSIREVGARLRAVCRRAGSEAADVTSDVVTAGGLRINCSTRTVSYNGRECALTAKEFDLLVILASNPGKVWHRETLLAEVWGEDFFGSGRTLDVHVGSIRRKLEDPQLIASQRGVGYCLVVKSV
jgi:two-component system response regulator RegX3